MSLVTPSPPVAPRDASRHFPRGRGTLTASLSEPGGEHTGRALAILTSLFFMWGFLTCLNDTIIPHLKSVFDLNYSGAMLVPFCFFSAYFLVSMPAGRLVERIGYKRGILVGLCTAGMGCLLFYPAAGTRSYNTFLLALFVLASGITVLQVSANPFVAILGPPQTASSRLTLTQAFNSLGTFIAPLFGSTLILSQTVKSPAQIAVLGPKELEVYRLAEAQSVQFPYLGLAAALSLLAVAIALLPLPSIAPGQENASPREESPTSSAWAHRHLTLGALGIFLYVGAEVAIGSFMVSYIGYLMGYPDAQAGKLLSCYWGGAMLGRFLGSAALQRLKPGRVLAFNAGLAALLVLVSMLTSGWMAMGTLLAVGLCNSVMFPTIFTLSISNLGPHTGQGSGILCAAIVGGAVIPTLQGVLADHIGIQPAFILPLLCYLYVVFYGLKGSRIA